MFTFHRFRLNAIINVRMTRQNSITITTDTRFSHRNPAYGLSPIKLRNETFTASVVNYLRHLRNTF